MHKVFAAAFAALALTVGAAQAQGDAVAGKKVFNKCKSCHAVGMKAKNKVGPPLNGIVGAKFGKTSGFKYSKSLRKMAGEGRVWDEETLDAYLKKPKDVIPKGRMAFPGLKKPAQRADVIAYLKSFNADGSQAE